MKKSFMVVFMVMSLSMAFFLYEDTWADGGAIVQPGGGGEMGGETPGCNEAYSGIDSADCGEKGGGKSWRVYKLNGSKKIDSVEDLNKGATWKLIEGSENGGKKITGKGSILSKCVDSGAPYIIVLGLNKRGIKEFEVSYKLAKVDNDCNKSKGCYYKWNTYFEEHGVAKKSGLDKASNGQSVKKGVVKKLYNKAKEKYGLTVDYEEAGAFCAWNGQEYTLTAMAKDTAGAALNGGNKIDSKTVEEGESATVNNIAIAGYTFKYWEYDGSQGSTLTVNPLNSNLTVYAVYEKNSFQGKIDVEGSVNDTTGWNSGNKDVYLTAKNCGTGCTVNFKHAIRTTAGEGSTPFSIDRGSNTAAIPKGWQIAPTYKDASGNVQIQQVTPSTDGTEVLVSGNLTLYVGNYACYTLFFNSGYGDSHATMCVTAAMPSVGNSSINLKVKDQQTTAAQYQGWVDEIYTKPGHTIEFSSDYTPAAQAGAKVWVNEIYSGSNLLGTNNYPQNFGGWKNGYNIQRIYNDSKINKSGTIGDTTKLEIKPDDNKIGISEDDVGKEFKEIATTNDTYKTVPKGVSFTQTTADENGYVKSRATIDFTTISKDAKVWVPYNFTTDVQIENHGLGEDEPEVLYAGEEKPNIQFNTYINPKKNALTTNGTDDQAYATKAKDVLQKLVVYNVASLDEKKEGGVMVGGRTADLCSGYFGEPDNETSCGHRDIEDSNSFMPKGKNEFSTSFMVQDLPAGSLVCVAMAVFPADSGLDSNWDNLNYSGSWRVSGSKCFKVAKRPSIQVWGGNTYSAGDIKTGLSVKRNLAGYTGYNAGAAQGTYVFGSWNELGIISGGSMSGFASGASLGYAFDNNGTLDPNPFGVNAPNADKNNHGGSDKGDICKLSILTFANSCENGVASGGGDGLDVVENIDNNKDALKNAAEYLLDDVEGGKELVEGDLTLGAIDTVSANDGKVLYKATGTITTNEITMSRGVAKVISASNVVINKNIMVADEIYNTFEDVPKLVIYANNDIKINCGVTRIDAVLVAEKKVVTCNNLDGDDEVVKINDEENAHQLVVNGAVISGRLIANRTYGAATGANSIVPAEIINFDPTLYLWNTNKNEDEESKKIESGLEATYTRELAPRY